MGHVLSVYIIYFGAALTKFKYEGFESIAAEKALRLHFSTDKKKAAERIRRVRGAARAGTQDAGGGRPILLR